MEGWQSGVYAHTYTHTYVSMHTHTYMHYFQQKSEDGRMTARDTRDYNVPIKLDIAMEGRVLKCVYVYECMYV